MKGLICVIAFLFYIIPTLIAQNYTGINGSMYAGSLSVSHNPAAIVHSPYKWDINFASIQYHANTNAIRSEKSPLFPHIDSFNYSFNSGNFKRYFDANFNMRLLNARIALNHRQTIAFGMNIRGYGHAHTDKFNYIDTIPTLHELIGINADKRSFAAQTVAATWLEFFGTYGMTVFDHDNARLNAAISVKYNRNISGGFGNVNNVGVEQNTIGANTEYYLVNGNAGYGYSAEIDQWSSDKSSRKNINDLLDAAGRSVSFDLGIEYILKSGAVTSVFEEDESYYDYDWKFGAALLDIGSNKYNYSTNSLGVSDVRPNISGNVLLDKFSAINRIEQFNDSLSSITIESNRLTGKFSIMQPTRLVLNADHYIEGNVYLNADVSLNLTALQGENKQNVHEINFITITPRWETKKLGVYLPMQVNHRGQFRFGTAFKAGPLLFGIHNLLNAFGKNKNVKGGGYLAIVIRSGNGRKVARSAYHECPEL